ncbi:hypothetical protein GGU11DRAFT_751446 [Lentinula aff. detonsa]|nr:hypothetical protein GGU11DRAFT_751446 [Lentinula aff. detonsa]
MGEIECDNSQAGELAIHAVHQPNTLSNTNSVNSSALSEWLDPVATFRSVKKAAEAYNVPYWTLVRRIDGTALPKKQAHDSQALLTQTEKETLVEWICYDHARVVGISWIADYKSAG